MILQHLGVRELLRAKRVCRDWKDTIETSHPLLQKLWLRPRSSMRVGFKPGDRGIRRGHSWVSQNGLSISASDIVANPYFHADLSLERKPAPSLWWPNTSDSRREMYICNPPAVSVLLAGYSDGDSIFEEWLHDAAGIKIKQVVDFTLAKFLEWNGPECWMGESTPGWCNGKLACQDGCRNPGACDARLEEVQMMGADKLANTCFVHGPPCDTGECDRYVPWREYWDAYCASFGCEHRS